MMKYHALLEQMKEVREYLLMSSRALTTEQLLCVPEGFRNNILWNVGHVITDNCTMLYPQCGHEFPLPNHYLGWFEPGTSPDTWTDPPSLKEILDAGERTKDKLIEDCEAGRMESYAPMKLDDGIVLTNIASAIAHCNTHEAIHLGVVLALRKLV